MVLGKRSWFPDFYDPLYVGILSFVCAFLIFLPKILFRKHDADKQKVITELQVVVSIALILNGIGTLGAFQLYTVGFQYDKFNHFVIPFLMTIQTFRFFNIWKGYSIKRSLTLAGLIVFVGGILWEVLEFSSDLIFHTRTWGVYGLDAWTDTIGDVSFNTLGIIFAIFVMTFFNRKKAQVIK